MAARRFTTLILLAGLALSVAILVTRLRGYHLPGNQQGYEPVQPIAFSHKQHAGDLQISCVYCHSGADNSKHAGIPAASTCMSCHRFVTASQNEMLPELLEARKEKRAPHPVISPELQKLYDALGLNDKLEPDPGKTPEPIKWVKVHNLPAYTCFDHRAHVNNSIACQTCHGPVETMDRIRQEEDLTMGWCVNCHRQSGRTDGAGKELHPATDCAACHH
jgi:hypothetical protein